MAYGIMQGCHHNGSYATQICTSVKQVSTSDLLRRYILHQHNGRLSFKI